MNPFELDFSFTLNLPYKECIGRLRRAQYNHNSLSGTFLERHEELLLDFYQLDDSQWDLSGEWRIETRKIVSVFRISGWLRAETDTITRLSGRIRARNSWLINLVLLSAYLLAFWFYLTFVPGADLFIPVLFTSLLVLFLAVGLVDARQRLATIKQRIQDSLGVYSR